MTDNRKSRRREIRRIKNSFSLEYTEVPKKAWPFLLPNMTRVFRNHSFVAMIFDGSRTPGGEPATKVLLRHNSGKPVQWSEMQDCKNQLFGPESRGCQYLPRESELIDQANIYWFFVKEIDYVPPT
jgi:hypothetical protein